MVEVSTAAMHLTGNNKTLHAPLRPTSPLQPVPHFLPECLSTLNVPIRPEDNSRAYIRFDWRNVSDYGVAVISFT